MEGLAVRGGLGCVLYGYGAWGGEGESWVWVVEPHLSFWAAGFQGER